VQQTNNFDNVILEDITSRIDKEEGWSDVYLKITSEIKTDISHVYVVKGLFCNKIVGIQIEISSKIQAGIVNGQLDSKVGFARNAVQFKSIGQESDEFIKAISNIYKQTTEKGFTKQTVSSTAFSLNEIPVKLDKKNYYKLKLFFEENNEELYSELFLNINTKEHEIELHEKDVDYRSNLIKLLTN
jgi:hypothetical protein